MVKPILSNTEMVRAILDGRKTVTRRVVKTQPMDGSTIYANICIAGKVCAEIWGNGTVNHIKQQYCPGDILYVRETWGDYRECEAGGCGYFLYRSDYPDGATTYQHPDGQLCDLPTWRPSIHMPREAARIFLRVTDVRVERLQEIDVDGIRAEGLTSVCVHVGDMEIAMQEFALLWDSTIKPADRERYGWAANPFCWVISFERISKDEAMQ